MMKIRVEGKASELLADILKPQPDGQLHLGVTGGSMEAATIDDIFTREVLFKDYLMEGFVKFTLKASEVPEGLELVVRGLGSNRDKFLYPHFKFIFSQAGRVAEIV